MGLKILAAAAAVALHLTTTVAHADDDVARGEAIFALCGTCHGTGGEGNPARGAPALAGLQRWYVEAQLQKFRGGLRAYNAGDVMGLQMRPMARTLTGDADVANVAAYVATLAPTSPAATLEGDATRGSQLYAPCTACHGLDGKGNEALKAPALVNQADWYIVAQLTSFRAGMRGTHQSDLTGMQMRPMSLTLPDDQALRDVAAYIRTLRK
jgi:cbb3-type cytochrome c oxidase subunit III